MLHRSTIMLFGLSQQLFCRDSRQRAKETAARSVPLQPTFGSGRNDMEGVQGGSAPALSAL